MEFSKLPLQVQSEVKSTLNAYDATTVYQKTDGTFYNTTATILHNGVYDVRVATYTADQVFSKEEQLLNYVRTFKDYPFHANGIHYTGKKDYRTLNGDWTKVELVGGDLVFS